MHWVVEMLAHIAVALGLVGLLFWAFDRALSDIYRRSDVQRETGVRPGGPPPWLWMVIPLCVGVVLILLAG